MKNLAKEQIPKLTKADIIAEVASKVGLSKDQAEKTVNALLDEVTTALSGDRKIAFTGFGTFYTSDRAPREGLNPQTKKRILIPSAKVAKFRVGKNLKKAVNQ